MVKSLELSGGVLVNRCDSIIQSIVDYFGCLDGLANCRKVAKGHIRKVPGS
jgi:hypothetical protein